MGWGNGCECQDEVGIPEGGRDGGEGRAMGGGGLDPHTLPWDLLSSPNTFPQWAQKKCSGCQVWSRAVRTFCAKRRGEVDGGGVGGRGWGEGTGLTSRMGPAQ